MEYENTNGTHSSDLKNADLFDFAPQYIEAGDVPVLPPPLIHFLRFKGPNSKANIWEYDIHHNVWVKFPNAPW